MSKHGLGAALGLLSWHDSDSEGLAGQDCWHQALPSNPIVALWLCFYRVTVQWVLIGLWSSLTYGWHVL